MTLATITSVTPKAILQACVNRQLQVPSILDQAGVEHGQLLDPTARIGAERVVALWQQARRAAGDDTIALDAACQVPIGGYRVFDYVFLSSPDLGTGLRKMIDLYPLLNQAFRFSLVQQGRRACFSVRWAAGDPPLPRLYALFVLAASKVRIEHMVGLRSTVRELRLTASAAGPWPAIEDWFGAPVRFSQPADEIVLDAELLAAPSQHSDPALCEVLSHYSRQLLRGDHTPTDLIAAVCDALAACARKGACGLRQVAQQLAVSPRSLQRRLAEQGCSYREIADAHRRRRCHALLQQPGVRFAEVAFELGFSEPSAFHRAFKRWTGMTPGQFADKSSRRQ